MWFKSKKRNADQPHERIEAMPKFLLYANDKPVTIFDTLDEAKSRASEFIGQGSSVRIESFVAPAPSEMWRFDTEADAWVHST